MGIDQHCLKWSLYDFRHILGWTLQLYFEIMRHDNLSKVAIFSALLKNHIMRAPCRPNVLC